MCNIRHDFDCEYLLNGWRYPKSERHDQQRFLPRLAKKSLMNFGPVITKLDMGVWTHLNQIFGRPHFGPQGAAT